MVVFFIAQIATSLGAPLMSDTTFTLPPEAIIYVAPIAVAPMLVCLLMGLELALVFSVVSAVSVALLTGGRLDI